MIHTPSINLLTKNLSPSLQVYVSDCLEEHAKLIDTILNLGYSPEELTFRDFLSGPMSDIRSDDTEALNLAFSDVRYELVPTIRFANKNIENPDDNISETSALVIEFHKRGMAF